MFRLDAKARDGKQLPFSIVYNKQHVNPNSPCILYLNQGEEKREPYDLSPNIIAMLDRGVIIAYPHLRGTYDISQEWFEAGCAELRLSNFCDLIDIARYIQEQEISHKICGFSTTPLSGLSLYRAALNAPDIIKACVIHNGLLDVVEYLNVDGLGASANSVKIFGDVRGSRDMYEFVKDYSPYQEDLSDVEFTDFLFTCHTKHPLAHQTRKFIAKLRENKENSDVYFREYLLTPAESIEIQQLSFLLSTAFLKFPNPKLNNNKNNNDNNEANQESTKTSSQ